MEWRVTLCQRPYERVACYCLDEFEISLRNSTAAPNAHKINPDTYIKAGPASPNPPYGSRSLVAHLHLVVDLRAVFRGDSDPDFGLSPCAVNLPARASRLPDAAVRAARLNAASTFPLSRYFDISRPTLRLAGNRLPGYPKSPTHRRQAYSMPQGSEGFCRTAFEQPLRECHARRQQPFGALARSSALGSAIAHRSRRHDSPFVARLESSERM
jgi:hypothetical protein